MAMTSLFLYAGLLAGADPAVVQAPAVWEDGWVIVRKPLYDLLATSRVVFPASTTPQGYTKRTVGLSGESLPAQTGTLAGSQACRSW
jgi:hypothetical protein